jgi:hypothetical protein
MQRRLKIRGGADSSLVGSPRGVAALRNAKSGEF